MTLGIKTEITLNKFKARPYQVPLFKAIEEDGIKRAVLVWHRRAGKDVAAFNLMIRMAIKTPGSYYYILPTYRQARLVLFEGMTIDGTKFLDYIPKEIIDKINIQEMKIKLKPLAGKNASTIYFLGSDNFDSLRGSNPKGIVFSEYAYQHEAVYPTLRPILVANDGWCVFISTPFGENHFYQLYEVAKNSPEWFHDIQTVHDTGVVSQELIEREISEQIMSPDKIKQEYYCDFTVGASGSLYATYLNRMELNGQITTVPWEPSFPVYTSWDLGMRDTTVIIFFQVIGNQIKIFDLYNNDSVGLEHYIHLVKNKEYTYAKHFAPHDIRVRDYSSGGFSRWDKAYEAGLTFDLAPDISIIDGIETVRTTLPRIWIDREKCRHLITALRDYRKEIDQRTMTYKPKIVHDKHSHYCFTADTLVWTRSGMRPIITLTEKDEVMTLEGWKRCTKAYKTQTDAKLVEVSFHDGTKVKCTPEHKFLTVNGWRSAKNLKKGSRIRSSLMKQHSSSMRVAIQKHRDINTIENGQDTFIEMFGLRHLVQFLKGIISTIKTMIHLTITYGTSSAYQFQSINHCLSPMLRDYPKRLETLQLNGMDLKKEESGTENMRKILKAGSDGHVKQSHASFVGSYSRPLKDLAPLQESSVMPTAKLLLVESVLEMKETQDVYDIGVPDVGHFALSNGAIVHNCDALRYLCLSYPQTRKGTSSEDITKAYNEAYYGGNQLPGMFR